MSEQELKQMQALDDAAEKAGGFLAQISDAKTAYDYRAIVKYCKEKGIEPLDITVRELNRFIIKS